MSQNIPREEIGTLPSTTKRRTSEEVRAAMFRTYIHEVLITFSPVPIVPQQYPASSSQEQ